MLVPLGPSLRVGSYASQDLSILPRSCCGSCCGELRRLTFFLAKMAKKYCGNLRRRRLHTKAVQKKLKMLARETPQLEPSSHPPRPTWVAVKTIMFTPSFAQSVRKKCRKGYFASRISDNWKIGSQSEEQDSRAGFSNINVF